MSWPVWGESLLSARVVISAQGTELCCMHMKLRIIESRMIEHFLTINLIEVTMSELNGFARALSAGLLESLCTCVLSNRLGSFDCND